MGMFNYVLTKEKLLCCDKEVTKWQSKSVYIKGLSGHSYALENTLAYIPLEDIHTCLLHAWCSDCKVLTEYKYTNGSSDDGRKIYRDVS
jgi:hypothetical protein